MTRCRMRLIPKLTATYFCSASLRSVSINCMRLSCVMLYLCTSTAGAESTGSCTHSNIHVPFDFPKNSSQPALFQVASFSELSCRIHAMQTICKSSPVSRPLKQHQSRSNNTYNFQLLTRTPNGVLVLSTRGSGHKREYTMAVGL